MPTNKRREALKERIGKLNTLINDEGGQGTFSYAMIFGEQMNELIALWIGGLITHANFVKLNTRYGPLYDYLAEIKKKYEALERTL